MPLLGQDVKVIGPGSNDQSEDAKPVFLLESFHGREALGSPFRYDLTVLSHERNIPAFAVLGQPLTISMDLGSRTRYFNGVVTYFAKVGFTDTYTRYAVVLNPNLSRLDYTRNCRIFKQASLSAQELEDSPAMQDTLSIATSVLLEREVAEVDDATEKQGGDKKNHVGVDRHYCVQYRETDLNFVQRLLEEEGIYYFFTHELGKHNMILADSIGAHRSKATTHDPILYLPRENNSAAPDEHFWSLTVAGSLYPGKFSVLRGYDPTQKRAPVPVPDGQIEDELAGNPAPAADFEDYDYPGGLSGKKQAKEEAVVRSEAGRSANTVIEVQGNAMGVSVGDLVTFKTEPGSHDNPVWVQDDMTAEYMVTSATYSFTINQHEVGDPNVADEPFRARYTLIDSRLQYRPQRTAPKPRIEGPQTAVVVGAESGKPKDEIYTDKFGRVKVKFDWDRTLGGDLNSSCWVRVSQVWAGQNWGAIHIPRVGQEVIVEFLDGDPDRPIITGRVYNANNPPPYALPEHRTQSGIKSRSTNEGSPGNFNELRFEDLKGKEELHMQAERDMSTLVKRNQSLSVGGDRTVGVTGNETIDIKQKLSLTVHNSRLEIIENGDTLAVQASDKRTEVDGQYTVFAKSLYQVLQGEDNELFKEGAIVKLKNKSCTLEFNAGNAKLTAADSITFECGSSKITMTKDGTIEIKASTGIALMCDSTEAVLTPSSADMKRGGSQVSLTDAAADIKHGASELALTDAGADMKGTMVKINS